MLVYVKLYTVLKYTYAVQTNRRNFRLLARVYRCHALQEMTIRIPKEESMPVSLVFFHTTIRSGRSFLMMFIPERIAVSHERTVTTNQLQLVLTNFLFLYQM